MGKHKTHILRPEKRQKYTVYDNKTDTPICVCETSDECASIMGIKRGTFYHSINHRNIAKRGNRWTVIKEGKCEEMYQ